MCFHKWSKWSKPFTTVVHKATGNFGDLGDYNEVYQERVCEKCGAVSTRFVREGVYTGREVNE